MTSPQTSPVLSSLKHGRLPAVNKDGFVVKTPFPNDDDSLSIVNSPSNSDKQHIPRNEEVGGAAAACAKATVLLNTRQRSNSMPTLIPMDHKMPPPLSSISSPNHSPTSNSSPNSEHNSTRAMTPPPRSTPFTPLAPSTQDINPLHNPKPRIYPPAKGPLPPLSTTNTESNESPQTTTHVPTMPTSGRSRRFSRSVLLPKLSDIESTESAKRSVLEEAQQEIYKHIMNHIQNIKQLLSQLEAPNSPNSQGMSYVTPYQLQRLESQIREEIISEHKTFWKVEESRLKLKICEIKEAQEKQIRVRNSKCKKLENEEYIVRCVLIDGQEALYNHYYESHQNLLLMFNELKRIDHAHHMDLYYCKW